MHGENFLNWGRAANYASNLEVLRHWLDRKLRDVLYAQANIPRACSASSEGSPIPICNLLKLMSNSPEPNPRRRQLDPEKYARLKAEVKAPYRGLRKTMYVAFGASGFIGGLIFLARLASGGDIVGILPNFALQVGVVAIAIGLFRWEQKVEAKNKR